MKIIKESKTYKQYRKKKKPVVRGWFVHPDPGNPITMDSFNNSADTADAPVSAMSEDLTAGLNRDELYDKLREYNISEDKLDNMTNQQLYRLLNKLDKR